MLLILTEEQWYNSCEAHEIVIGEPSADNIIYVVNIFRNEGRDDSGGNPSMAYLLKDSSY